MFILQGPYPLLQNTVILPSPQLQDTETIPVSVVWKQAMDGTNYTYAQSNRVVERIYNFSFSDVAYDKMQELVNFYMICATSELRIRFEVDSNPLLLARVRFIQPVLDRTIDKRAKDACATVIKESVSFSLTFRGYTL